MLQTGADPLACRSNGLLRFLTGEPVVFLIFATIHLNIKQEEPSKTRPIILACMEKNYFGNPPPGAPLP
jgi:hypothetical protein